jgi:hypothetical protein
VAINLTSYQAALQAKLDAVTTDEKEMLLLGKAVEATIGNATVTDIQTEGTTQVNAVNTAGSTKTGEVNTAGTTQVSAVNSAGTTQVAAVNSIATGTFKTVGGSSILGSGDIATLPSGGSAGQVVKKDASNNAVWGADEGGKVLQYVSKVISAESSNTIQPLNDTYISSPSGNFAITFTPVKTGSTLILTASLFTENNRSNNSTWDTYYNFYEQSSGRINSPDNTNEATGMATQTYDNRDDDSTPEMVNMITAKSSGQVAGVTKTFNIVATGLGGTCVLYINRCVGGTSVPSGRESGISYFSIMEVDV